MKRALSECNVFILGDMNICLMRMEDENYYLKKIAEEYQSMIGQNGLDIIGFGVTWTRLHKNGKIRKSSLDHGLTNDPSQIVDSKKVEVGFSDHSAVIIDINTNLKKAKRMKRNTRDMRKLRANPNKFVEELRKIDWTYITSGDDRANIVDVDDIVNYWTESVQNVLDLLAPKKSKSIGKKKKVQLPPSVKQKLQRRNEMAKEISQAEEGHVSKEMVMEYKKHKNFCNRLVKKVILENEGINITEKSSLNQIWKVIGDVLRPERLATNQLKVMVNDTVSEDPKVISEAFVKFFKKKVDDLAEGIKPTNINDHLAPLRKKFEKSVLKFSFKPVEVHTVRKILKELKSKTSSGPDGISSEILKMGADVLAEPLTAIANKSIETSKFPTSWKEAIVCPLFKKGDRKLLQNYRPVSLLCVAGMVLERACCIQIEEFLEQNNILQSFQFGFRAHKSCISELLTLFDILLEAKEDNKEIALILFDLSAAFDLADHEILLRKCEIYGFTTQAVEWLRSYLKNRSQRVMVSGEISSSVEINRGTPQRSRLSPILFLIIMADLNLHTDKGHLSNFAVVKIIY